MSVIEDLNKSMTYKLFIYGGSGTGKTTFIMHALSNLVYEDLYILCATAWDDYELLANLFTVTNKYDYDHLMTWMTTSNGKKKLLVLDDILSMGLNTKNVIRGQLAGIFADARHYNCNIIVSTQKIKGVPDTIRMLYTHVVATRMDFHLLDMIVGDLPEAFLGAKKLEIIRELYVRDFEYLYFTNHGQWYKFRLNI